MNRRIALLVLLGMSLVGMVPAYAGQMVLEAQPKVNAAAENPCDIFTVCSIWHELSPNYCQYWHVIYCGPAIENATSVQGINNVVDKKFFGHQLVLENQSGSRKVKVDRVVPQYHLATGAIVEPAGKWSARDANGEEWREVRSYAQLRLSVANWEDSNKDGVVGPGDRVVFDDGTATTIKAVRLGLHVSDSNRL